MPRETRAAKQNRAVEKRTQERLAARKEATRRGVETRQRNREAQLKRQRAEPQEKAHVGPQTAEPQQAQPQTGGRQTKRSQRDVAQDKPAADRGEMATVALRGEPAQRFRALAAKEKLTLSKLLVRMMEVFEKQMARPTAAG